MLVRHHHVEPIKHRPKIVRRDRACRPHVLVLHLDPHVLELLPDLPQYDLGEIPRVHIRRVRGGCGGRETSRITALVQAERQQQKTSVSGCWLAAWNVVVVKIGAFLQERNNLAAAQHAPVRLSHHPLAESSEVKGASALQVIVRKHPVAQTDTT